MNYFWYTEEIIPEGMGFSLFDGFHLSWLAAGVAAIVICCLAYRKLDTQKRSIFRKTVAVLLIIDELFKQIPMFFMGTFMLKYLPFHLCSVNIFVIAWHAWRPNKTIDNFLYTVCIPAATAAMLFCNWTELPAWNYSVIHSFTVHILLILYPVVLTAAGEIKPELKEIPKSLLLLAGLACVALVLNLMWDTNFMFLMYSDKGNPLEWFEKAWGDHRLGFPVLITAVVAVMHAPWIIARKVKQNPKI